MADTMKTSEVKSFSLIAVRGDVKVCVCGGRGGGGGPGGGVVGGAFNVYVPDMWCGTR